MKIWNAMVLWMALPGVVAGAGLEAGAAAVDISPQTLPVITNCQMLERTSSVVTSPLYARTVVLGEGGKKVSITVVDSCMLPRELVDGAKAKAAELTGMAVERMLIAATHAHSAPAAMACLGSRAQADYAAWLPGKIAESIAAAHGRMAAAEAGWAVEEDWEHTHTRRWIYHPDKMLKDPFGNVTVRANMHPGYQNPNAITPSGPSDPALTVLAVRRLDGKPVAVLANYSQHYFGAADVSPDYYGLFAAKVAAALQAPGEFAAMMSQGTSGDQMWMDYGAPKSSIGLEQYASEVTAVALRAYRRIRYERELPLGMEETRMRFGRRTPDAARLEWARPMVEAMGERQPKSQVEVYAREQVLLAAEPERELKLQVVRLGDLALNAIPNEVFALSGLKLKRRSPFGTVMNLELANGAEGYIPPPEQHALGGYTTWPARSAGLEVGAEPRIVETLLAMQERLAGKKRRVAVEPETPYAVTVRESRPALVARMGEMDGATGVGTVEGLRAYAVPGHTGVHSAAIYLAGGRWRAETGALAGDFTIEFWMWPGKTETTLVDFGGLALGLDGKGHMTLGMLRSSDAVAVRQWHHIGVVKRGGQVQVYRNGAGVFRGEWRGGVRRELLMGPFEGKVDEVAVYGRALAAVEVLNHFSAAGER